MNEFYIILAGVLLRIAIPALVIIGLAVLVSRMDAGWKRESQRLEQEPTSASDEQKPCWEIKDCSPEQMSGCPAAKSDQPCWQSFHQENGLPNPNCLECVVFQSSVYPIPQTASTH